ncbi:MAG: lytic transglycosylase domain-containing protein [Rhodocyclaceae bacterium]|nr:MAG: lytic transglycosylase domain-containing protein [Rhodocyclaceae bacterium]
MPIDRCAPSLRHIAAIFLLCTACRGFAGNGLAQAESGYRLRLPAPDAFRLADTSRYRAQLPTGRLPEDAPFRDWVEEAAHKRHLDPALLQAVIQVESGYNATAVSAKGAQGLGQLMPDTARRYGVVNPHDPRQNLDGAAAYLHDLLQRFDADTPVALAAYNAGEGAVERHGRRIPPYAETRRYVPAVLARYRQIDAKRTSPYRLVKPHPAPAPAIAAEGQRKDAPTRIASFPSSGPKAPAADSSFRGR